MWNGDGLPRRRADGADRVVRPYFLSFRASPQTGVGIRLSSPPSEREVSARSADGGRDATRFSLPQSAAPTAPSQRGLTARRCRADGTSRRRPLRKMRIATPVTAGHTGPALQGAAVIQGGQSRPPLYSAKRDGCRRLFLFNYTAAPRR